MVGLSNDWWGCLFIAAASVTAAAETAEGCPDAEESEPEADCDSSTFGKGARRRGSD